jgi:type IV secretory pathway VirB2 component (pilin)
LLSSGATTTSIVSIGEGEFMTRTAKSTIALSWRSLVRGTLAALLLSTTAFAQSPWERAAANLEATFTGPLARSLALVAIVIGGLMFMFGEGGAKRQISGIVFGGGLALFAAQFLAWLF